MGSLRNSNIALVPSMEPIGTSLYTCMLVDLVVDNAKSTTVSNILLCDSIVWVKSAIEDEMVALDEDIDDDSSVYPVSTLVTIDDDTLATVVTTDEDTSARVLYIALDTSFV